MPLIRFPTPAGLVYTIDLSKIADRANPRTVEAPISTSGNYPAAVEIDWGDGTTETKTSGAWPSHTYAAGAGDVFTVVIRSAEGTLPEIMYTSDNSVTDTPTRALTFAVTSIDHFGGWIGSQTARVYRYVLQNTVNLEYFDARIFGQSTWTNLQRAFDNCGSTQPFKSLCFDFLDALGALYMAFYQCNMTGPLPDRMLADKPLTSIVSCFQECTGLTYIPTNLFDGSTVTSFYMTFRGCNNAALTDPYVFWKSDGSFDTDKFPGLNNGQYCYTGCNDTLSGKVPSAYGGTM